MISFAIPPLSSTINISTINQSHELDQANPVSTTPTMELTSILLDIMALGMRAQARVVVGDKDCSCGPAGTKKFIVRLNPLPLPFFTNYSPSIDRGRAVLTRGLAGQTQPQLEVTDAEEVRDEALCK